VQEPCRCAGALCEIAVEPGTEQPEAQPALVFHAEIIARRPAVLAPPGTFDAFGAFGRDHLVQGPPPSETLELRPRETWQILPAPKKTAFDELLAGRTTCRNFDPDFRLPLNDASAILHRVFAAQAQHELAPGAIALKKNSPSGGGLHPVEAFVLVQRVDDLGPQRLRRRAEDALRDLGFRQFRVRLHDKLARVEIAPDRRRVFCMAVTAPVISSTVSPRTRSAMSSAPICEGVASPDIMRSNPRAASSRVSAAPVAVLAMSALKSSVTPSALRMNWID